MEPRRHTVYAGDSDGRRWETLCSSLSADVAGRTLVVHGDQDATVPVDDSRALAAATSVALEVVPGGDHSLNSALIHSTDGEGMNDRLRQLVVEVASRR